MRPWRAGCGRTRTSGSAGGGEENSGRKTATRASPPTQHRRGHRHLTSVVDPRAGAVVWCAPGRNAATLQAFFDELGPRKRSIRAVSIDMSGGYEKAIRDNVPGAEVCFDPFHVVRLGQRAVDQVRRDEWNAHERSHTPKGPLDQGHPLVAAQGAGQAIRAPAPAAPRSLATQQ